MGFERFICLFLSFLITKEQGQEKHVAAEWYYFGVLPSLFLLLLQIPEDLESDDLARRQKWTIQRTSAFSRSNA